MYQGIVILLSSFGCNAISATVTIDAGLELEGVFAAIGDGHDGAEFAAEDGLYDGAEFVAYDIICLSHMNIMSLKLG